MSEDTTAVKSDKMEEKKAAGSEENRSDKNTVQTMHNPEKRKASSLVSVILRAVALAMGVTVCMLSVLRDFNEEVAIGMLGLGLACLAAAALARKEDDNP